MAEELSAQEILNLSIGEELVFGVDHENRLGNVQYEMVIWTPDQGFKLWAKNLFFSEAFAKKLIMDRIVRQARIPVRYLEAWGWLNTEIVKSSSWGWYYRPDELNIATQPEFSTPAPVIVTENERYQISLKMRSISWVTIKA